MSFFEVVLFALAIIFLIDKFISRFDKSVKKWSYMIAGAIFVLHLIFEGYRWQVLPLYLVFAFLLTSFLTKKRASTFLRVVQGIFLSLTLLVSLFLSYALPVLKFKNVDGNYEVGVKEVHLIDSNRTEFMTEDPNDKREVSIRIFYPTPVKHNSRYPYIPNFKKIRHTYKKKLGWPDFMLNYLELFTIEAQKDAPYFQKDNFPLLFYSHGLTNNYNESSGRLMKIASNGYVVVAINHTYGSDFGILKNGKVVGYKPLSILGDPIRKIDSVKTIIANQWYNDLKFVNGELEKRTISRNIDFNNIALMGFSAGGTMSTIGGYELENVKAVINLDGTPRGFDYSSKPKAPYLGLFSEPLQFSDEQIKAWGIDRELVEAPKRMIKERSLHVKSVSPQPSYLITIPKTKHSNFIEYPLVSPLSNYLDIGGSINTRASYNFINEIILLFLDSNLKGKIYKDLDEVIEKGKNKFDLDIVN